MSNDDDARQGTLADAVVAVRHAVEVRRVDHAVVQRHDDLLQDARVPPWQRERLPLLSAADGTLLAAGDRLCSATLAGWLDARGARLQWTAVA